MAEIKKIFVNGKDEVEFFKQLEKRSGETNKKVTAVVNEIIEQKSLTASSQSIMKFQEML